MGSTIESGLLIALGMILFLMLITISVNIYDWVIEEVEKVLNLSVIE